MYRRKMSFIAFLMAAVLVFTVGCKNTSSEGTFIQLVPENSEIPIDVEALSEVANTEDSTETSEETEATDETEETEETEAVTPVASSVLVTFIGDVTLTQNFGSASSTSFERVVGDDYDYCFENCKEIFESDDLTLANLEGAVTTRRAHATKQFVFGMQPESLNMLVNNSIEAVNLANNHTQDFLAEGLSDTKKNLDEYNIVWSDQKNVAVYEVNGIRIGMFGITEYTGVQTGLNDIDTLKSMDCNIIIASVHWGVEATYKPTSTQEAMGRRLLDYGADIVIGTHPHRLQRIEEYNGKYILYSLSNFCFGGNSNLSDPDTAIIQCEFIMDETGTNCVEYKLNVIPYSQTGRNGNDFKPVPYEWGSEKYYRVLSRLEWSQEDE